MKNSKIYLRVCSLLFACFLVCGSILSPAVTYASPYDLMINTGSNALMTLELDDADYLMMPRSSVGTVENTVDEVTFAIMVTNGTYTNSFSYKLQPSGGRFQIPKFQMPDYYDGYWIQRILIYIQDDLTGLNSLPRPSGNYHFSMDLSSDFSYELARQVYWLSSYKYDNSVYDQKQINLGNYSFASGDLYVPPIALNIKSGYYFNRIDIWPSTASNLLNLGGSFALRFTPTDEEGLFMTGPNSSNTDIYEDSVSDSLSDLSSSVGEMSDEISGVTEAIQNLQGAMEPHYNNVLTQLHHITEQLHAFYDQIYNNIHLKEYALWQDIKTAIENIDLEVNVNLDKLKTSIDNMSQAIQNKLQSVTDTITGGYDNSGIEQNGNALDSSINEYEEAEQNVLESVNDSLNDFEFDADLTEYKNIVQVISDFLQELYDSSGGFKLVINLSLMLSVASIVIGVYRFKEGG